MNSKLVSNKILVSGVSFMVGILVASISVIGWRMNDHEEHEAHHNHMSMDDHRTAFLDEKEEIISTLIAKGDYACCLEKPCTYCIEKTPGHGEGATCSCLEDVVNGRHPCGECIGEIIEGHGNKFLVPYFTDAISEEVGEHHKEVIQQIINEKYKDAV